MVMTRLTEAMKFREYQADAAACWSEQRHLYKGKVMLDSTVLLLALAAAGCGSCSGTYSFDELTMDGGESTDVTGESTEPTDDAGEDTAVDSDAAGDEVEPRDAEDLQEEEPGPQPPVHFTVVGDTHAGIDPEEFPVYHQHANHNHREAVIAMAALGPDLYFHLGDMVQQPNDFAWNEFFNIEDSLINLKPVYPIIGNHEEYHHDKSFYRNFIEFPHLSGLLNMDRPWYAFDRGNTRFICLRMDYDGWNPDGEPCAPGSLQYQWLEDELQNTDQPWKIIFMHVSIYSSASEGMEEAKDVRAYLHPLFLENEVDIVFSGHDHYYERVEADGIVYITSGGGSNPHTLPSAPIPQSLVLTGRNHIVEVTVDGAHLSATAISTHASGNGWETEGGDVLDRFNLDKDI
jgi:predicted phosphodiesterase